MSSPRERAERAARAIEPPEKPDVVRPIAQTTKMQGGTGASTRELAERAATAAIPEATRPNKAALRYAGLTFTAQNVGTVRGRLEQKAAIEAEKAAPTTAEQERLRLINFYADAYEKEQAQKLADEAAQRQKEREKEQAADAERKRRLFVKLLDIVYSDATDIERRRCESLVKAQGRYDDTEAHRYMLTKLRVAFE